MEICTDFFFNMKYQHKFFDNTKSCTCFSCYNETTTTIIFLLRHMHVFAFKSTLKSYLVCETWCIVGPFSPVFCQPITVSIARLYRRSWNKNDTVITLGIIGVVWDHKSILQIFIKTPTPSTPSHIGDRFKDKWTTFV